MVTYQVIQKAVFLKRVNRFVAVCRLNGSGEQVTVHVKNTGRCRELLVAQAEVSLSYEAHDRRKTAYDLIAVKKDGQWVNIDSLAPNQLVYDGIASGIIKVPGLKGDICLLQREKQIGSSRFDLYIETTLQEKLIVEVKGVTLAKNGVAAFPDAPTLRGLKHVQSLHRLMSEGYRSLVVFVVQLASVDVATIHAGMQPELQAAFVAGMADGLDVAAYSCQVTARSIKLKKPIPFDINESFE
ncbi:DNA/RNA nuclease SfsA [Vagococcus acidifermentans]|uniref:Sugar fermentation stimulation protein homolog n=1 Tax=Vagococcus acidifermentans TaxID=564710 RepID=A0A430AQ97_9ENTE|nr:DNA/RNA nuclease SfsA [Vagococcus acidifermentans]RSU10236.1 sugar fermentation stimulation protein SfsA [Vagococcus acidifermentans]